MYHHVENPVLETFTSAMTVEPWNILTEDFTSLPASYWNHQEADLFDRLQKCEVESPSSKMMNDHSLIISDSHMDHPSFITMKTQGLEEVVLDTSHVNQLNHLFLSEPEGVVPNELIVGQNVEGGVEDPHAEVILIPNSMIKQEDIIEGSEVIVGSYVDNEVIIHDHMEDTNLETDHFNIASSIDIGADQIDDTGFEDTKLIIDTEEAYNIEEPEPTTYNCGECGVMFRNRTSLKKHVKSMHIIKLSKSKLKKSSKDKGGSVSQRYYCPSCSYSSGKRDKFDKHMERHVMMDGVHPCGKKRHRPEALPQRHRHNAEEYRCSHCPYTCTVFKALRKHQKVHILGNETFTLKLSCKICGKDRPTESEMQRHMTKKHKNNDHFLCDLCSFSSVQLKKIIQHRRMHTGEKPHLCPHCPYRSARRDNLRSHVRRMHKRSNMYIDTFNPNEENALAMY